MFKLLSLSFLLATVLKVESNDVGPGIWSLKHINKCEEDRHVFKFEVEKKKLNRTHDSIDAAMLLEEDFTDQFAIRVDVCKNVDGGCKPYQTMFDESFASFVNKYAKENVKSVLQTVNLDPPDFPIPSGKYDIKDFMFNYDELPKEGPYGEFTAKAYMLRGSEEMGCVEVDAEFKEDDE